MSDEQPEFTTQPLTDDSANTPKKLAKPRAKRKPKPKTEQPVSSPAQEPSPTDQIEAPIISAANEKAISDCLTTIYQNEDGNLPNMHDISIQKSSPIKKLLACIIFGGAFAALCAWAYWFYLPNSKPTNDEQVTVRLQGAENIFAGDSATYDITYANNGDVTLQNVRLNIAYPKNFVFATSSIPASNDGKNEWQLGPLESHRRGTLSVTGRFFDLPGTAVSWRASLFYRPANFNSDTQSELQKDALLTTNLTDSTFAVQMNGPSEVAVGLENTYSFTVSSSKSVAFASLDLAPTYPPNFTITSSSPKLGKDGRWHITSPTPANPGVTSTPATDAPTIYKIRGVWQDTNASTPLSAILSVNPANKIGPFTVAQANLPVHVTAGALSLNLAINGSLSNVSTTPGGTLNVTVRLKNTTNKEIKNIVLKTIFDAASVKSQSILKWAALSDSNDGDTQGSQLNTAIRRGTLLWNGKKISSLASLKSNDEVVLDFVLPLKNMKEIDWSAVTTSTIGVSPVASFTGDGGTTQTVAGSPLLISINSDTSLEVQENTGANAGDHALTWVLRNTLHPLKDIVISAHVFNGANIVHDTAPDAGTVTLDETGKILTWQIPQMPDSLDVLTAPFVVSMPAPDPSQNTLLSKTHVTAIDTVTNQTISFDINELPL